jgi:hypothetical protein
MSTSDEHRRIAPNEVVFRRRIAPNEVVFRRRITPSEIVFLGRHRRWRHDID